MPAVDTKPFRRNRRWRDGAGRVVLALALALAFGLAEAWATEVRLAVEVLDAKGDEPQNLAPGDLEVREGDTLLPLAGLNPESAPSRVVLYFDQALSSSGTLKRAASGLAGLSRQLVTLGEVEVVMATDAPETTLASRDELVVQETLSRSALTDSGERRVLEIRQRVLRELRLTTPAAAPPPEEIADIVAAGVEEEIELIRERQHQLIAWASEPGSSGAGRSGGPSLLMFVSEGFDLDPVSFYLQALDTEATRAVIPRLSRLESLDASTRRLARTLAALGWTVVPVAIEPAGEEAGLEYAPIEVDADRGGATSAPGITVRPGSLFGRRRQADEEPPPAARLLEPRAPLALVAEASGGELIATDRALRDAVERFAGRFELVYRSALPLEIGSERLEVLARRPGLTVRAPRWVSRGLPDQVAAVRLERLLAGISYDGGFDVAAVLKLEESEEEDSAGLQAELEARLELRELDASSPDGPRRELDEATFRVTLAVAAAGKEPRLEREVVRADRLRQLEEWRYTTEVDLPPDATEVAVLVEDLGRGLWGGRRATVVQGDFAAGSDLLPAPAVVEILPPEKELLRGRIKFATEVYDPRVARVDFLLDDRAAASKRQAPFTARLDLGRTPRRRELTVVAYDAGGGELGRDSVVLNGGAGGLGVEIVRPASFRGTGWVEVEAEVSIPLERRLDRVLFFWNNQQVATVYGAPFRQRVLIPEDRPVGYVRVVALLEDGTLAEDVAFMNGPEHGERVEVNLVELYVVVTDKNGRPVRGLGQSDFQVREDGVRQDIATFSDASDLPLTLGMAIDSSASMFVKLPAVQSAAIDFLHATFTDQDRAFVVDFDSEPRLARSTTSSLDRIVNSIDSLEANGRTALWESIVFSLVQLQGVRGRKALIVFSDGSDEDDQFPFRSSLDIAKRMGVPIYLILMRKEPKKEAGMSLLVRSFSSRVNRLVEATGGRVFYAKEYANLGQVYEDIERELRSQYLLAYYPRPPSRGESWRDVDVDVDRRGLTPRTLSGYWQ